MFIPLHLLRLQGYHHPSLGHVRNPSTSIMQTTHSEILGEGEQWKMVCKDHDIKLGSLSRVLGHNPFNKTWNTKWMFDFNVKALQEESATICFAERIWKKIRVIKLTSTRTLSCGLALSYVWLEDSNCLKLILIARAQLKFHFSLKVTQELNETS